MTFRRTSGAPAAPSGTNASDVATDPTGLDVFTAVDVQAFLEQADAEVVALLAAIATKATLADIATATAALVDSSPDLMNTLNEISAALADDPNFATTVTNLIAAKVAKADYDANSFLAADTDDTPTARTVAEDRIVGRITGGNIGGLTAAQVRTLLDLANLFQAKDDELTAIAGLTSAANKLPYFTGSGAASLADLSAFARTLLDDADATAALATLGASASGHSHAGGLTAAILRGALGYDTNTVEPFPRWAAVGGDAALTSGAAEWACFTALENITVSKIMMMVGGTASAGSPTLRRMGLATVAGNGDITVVARTANDTSLFNATFTSFEKSFDTGSGFPATYDLVAGNRYAVGVIAVGGTMPALQRMLMANGNNPFFAIAPRLTIGKTGQTDLTDITAASGTTPSAPRWARLSA